MNYITHYLAVSICFLAFSLNGQEVAISIDHPDRVDAGGDFTITVNIKKGSLTDYSRFSQDLPLGLTATNGSAPNADFSFDDQRVRIIWLKMPNTSEVSVSYLVSVDSRLKGTFNLGGVFAYVVDDERKFLKLDQNKEITIVPNSSLNQELAVDIEDFNGEASDLSAAPSEGAHFAMAVRQKPTLLNSGSYLVRLIINNPAGSKYAKVEETIPSGYLFEEVNSNGGIVSHAASTLKFIWMRLPEQSEFEVSYRLVPQLNEPQGDMAIEGLLTYTEGDENRVAEIVEMDLSLDNLTQTQRKDLLATGTVPPGGKAPSDGTKEAPVVKPVNNGPATSSDAGRAADRFIINTRVLSRGSGDYYRVQLSANLNAFDGTAFYRLAGVDMDVAVEQHDGFFKYTTGPFQSYDQALLYRDRVEKLADVEGSFLVRYKNGRRVTADPNR
jgi:hypothetical protein